MKRPNVVLYAMISLIVIVACFNAATATLPQEQAKREKPEVISLLGKELFATPAEGDDLAKLEADLAEAKKNLATDPENPELIVWFGRRLAYLWRYHEAIDVYTIGIEKFPDYAMLYRHRGHRYISIRKFDKAVEDLTKASQLNDSDFDIWYHLALAHYLKADFAAAESDYRHCLEAAEDDDSVIAVSNWLYITLRRQGKTKEAAELLEKITPDMEVVENGSYHNLLLFYKGLKSKEELVGLAEQSDLDRATLGYGLGCRQLYNAGDAESAKRWFERIVDGKYWPAFGFIAAEAELARNPD